MAVERIEEAESTVDMGGEHAAKVGEVAEAESIEKREAACTGAPSG